VKTPPNSFKETETERIMTRLFVAYVSGKKLLSGSESEKKFKATLYAVAYELASIKRLVFHEFILITLCNGLLIVAACLLIKSWIK